MTSKLASSLARRQIRINVRVKRLYSKDLSGQVLRHMGDRVEAIMAVLRDQIKLNLSIPVVRDGSGRVRVRSLPGEFPRLETERLRKDIFSEVVRQGSNWRGRVGTTLEYGRVLETSSRLDRSFMIRTYREMRPELKKIVLGKTLVGRGRGGSVGVGVRR